MQLADHVIELAKKKGCTAAQLAINWVKAQSKRPGMPVIIPIPGATTAEKVIENSVEIELSDAELKEIDEMLSKFDVQGGRYPAQIPHNT